MSLDDREDVEIEEDDPNLSDNGYGRKGLDYFALTGS
jgi:hypothetical protein